ncbi:sn-glycerol-3-phosphate transport system permease protein ugpE [Streptococcus pyogenes]|nr:sn-glycerol-3-phosphate transport system permease protein ugpE [Streptococcus pyogenes]
MTKKKLTASDILTTVMLCVLTILFIFPFYWIMTGAFKASRYHYDSTAMVAKGTYY